ncbi:MAG: ribbon-helix-helix protein, CopG family [Maritimibacter sp.]|jgi:hypothetical protein
MLAHTGHMETVKFKLPKEVIARLEALAREEDVTIGQLLRLAVERDLRRRESFQPHPRIDQRLLTPIKVELEREFVAAKGWTDLKDRLAGRGYSLREAGGGLALHDLVSGRFLCRTSEIGFGYPTLIRQLGGPFPGHSHTWLLDRIRAVPVYVRR